MTPQQELIVKVLRDKDWHCQTEWLGVIKDDRKRISELNEEGSYLHSKGYEIIGKPCDGRCGKTHPSRLYMRKAVKIDPVARSIEWFDSLPIVLA